MTWKLIYYDLYINEVESNENNIEKNIENNIEKNIENNIEKNIENNIN